MKNINTSFESFVNEGIIPSGIKRRASKTFKPGEMGDIIKKIFYDIKNNFDIDKLEKKTVGLGKTFIGYFIYKTSLGDTIKVSRDGNLYINEDNVAEHVNRNIAIDIYNYFQNKYIVRDHEKYRRDKSARASSMRDKYSKYLDLHEDAQGILKHMKHNFDVSNLDKGLTAGEIGTTYYTYKTAHGDTIKAFPSKLIINQDDLTPYVHENIINNIYSFLHKKYNNRSDEIRNQARMKKIDKVRDKYGKYVPSGMMPTESLTNENILPKPYKKVKCQECGEEVCDNLNYKIGHLYNKHNCKPSVDDYKAKKMLKQYF